MQEAARLKAASTFALCVLSPSRLPVLPIGIQAPHHAAPAGRDKPVTYRAV